MFTARNFTLSREGQVTDRYTKAIEQLGSDKLDVRIGGIYALERVARDSARDHPTVMEVLTAFIREHSHEQWPPPDPGGQERARSTRPDVQAAVTVVGRRDAKRDIDQRINLTGANLVGADLTGANLTSATSPARTSAARTSPARTSPARTSRRGPHGADLTGADLTGANLTGADLTGADLTGATSPARTSRGANLYRRGPHRREPQRRGPHRRGPHRRGPHRREPHRREVARRCASSGGLETRHRLWPTGESSH